MMHRGSQGVGIVLNGDGISAWKAAGYEKHIDYGARIIAIRQRQTRRWYISGVRICPGW